MWSYCIWEKTEKLWPTIALRFAETHDLVNFKRFGKSVELRQDSRWYQGRWDTLFVLPRDEGGWIGVINTGPKKGRGLGFATSADGIHWEAQPPLQVNVPWLPDRGIAGEVSAFAKLKSKLWFKWWTGNEKLKTQPISLPSNDVRSPQAGPIAMLGERFALNKGLVIEGSVALGLADWASSHPEART